MTEPIRDDTVGQQRAMPATVARVSAEGRRAASDLRESYACEICGNVPNEYGELEHGRGCYKLNSDGVGMEYVDMASDPIRDDTQEAFPLSGKGPLTPAIDAWPAPEPYPLPIDASFDMPQPFDSPQQQLVDRLVVAQRRGDHATFAEVLDRLYELREVTNNNSGACAPIQGE